MGVFSGTTLIIAYIFFVIILLCFIVQCIIFGRKDYRNCLSRQMQRKKK